MMKADPPTAKTSLYPCFAVDTVAAALRYCRTSSGQSNSGSRHTVSVMLRSIASVSLLLLAAVACGGEPVTVADTPVPRESARSVGPAPTPTPPDAPQLTLTPTPPPTVTPEPTATLAPTSVPTQSNTQTPTTTPAPTETTTLTPTPTSAATTTTDAYYTESVDVDGILIKASGAVAPEALEVAADIVRTMLSHRPDITRRMAEAGASLAIIPKDGYIVEIPELAFLRGRLDPNGNPYDSFRVRGAGGVPGQTTTVTSEENLLDLVEDQTRFWAEDITVHEWAHAIENLGFDDDTRQVWLELFRRTGEAGLWPDAFGMRVEGGREFFAEMSQSYLGVNNEIGGPGDLYSEGADGIQAEIFAALEDIYGPVDFSERPDGN